MGVPASGSFSMFGTGSNTTIQGAINQSDGADGSNDAANGLTQFSQLISASQVNMFHPASNIISGNPTAITNLSQVNNALQYRRYPTVEISLCFDSTSSSNACNCSGSNSASYYAFGNAGNLVTTLFNATVLTNQDGSLANSGFYSAGTGSDGDFRFWNKTAESFGSQSGISVQTGTLEASGTGQCIAVVTILYT